jgi:hypothetical protein
MPYRLCRKMQLGHITPISFSHTHTHTPLPLSNSSGMKKTKSFFPTPLRWKPGEQQRVHYHPPVPGLTAFASCTEAAPVDSQMLRDGQAPWLTLGQSPPCLACFCQGSVFHLSPLYLQTRRMSRVTTLLIRVSESTGKSSQKFCLVYFLLWEGRGQLNTLRENFL